MHTKAQNIMTKLSASHRLLSLLLLAGAAVCLQAHAQMPAGHQQGAIEYVTGGVSTEESDAIKAAMSEFPLVLTFGSHREGKAAYVADVQVVIRDDHDSNVLNITADGPYCLVKLPAGQYQVFATYKGETKSKKVDVPASGTERAMFEWNQPK